MAVPFNRADAVAYAAIGLAVLSGLALWPRLPAEMAIHFDATSTPDSFVARPVGVLLTPTIGVAAILLVRRGRELSGGSPSPAVEDAAVAFVGVLVAYVHGLVLAWNVGLRFDVTAAVLPVLALAGALVVYAAWREGRLPTRP
ncbi:MAG: DUF1648 domain-containing protein [Haloarculaceae archaeon]